MAELCKTLTAIVEHGYSFFEKKKEKDEEGELPLTNRKPCRGFVRLDAVQHLIIRTKTTVQIYDCAQKW